jgi:hypothetical protein
VPSSLATPDVLVPKLKRLHALAPPALLLPALGVAVGLLTAGVALLHRPPGPLSTVPPGYVALVNQKGILTSDFIAQTAMEAEKPFAETTPAERRKVLHEMIDEELMVQRALLLDLPETTTEVRNVMVEGVRAQVTAPLLATPPTDAELHRFYDAHRASYTKGGTMLVRDLVLHIGGYQNADQSLSQAQSDANEAVYQLRSGSSADYVMEHFGFIDSPRSSSTEQLEFAAKLLLGAKLYAVATTLGDGDISDPITDADGVHVLIMQQRQPPILADFSAVRAQVYEDYRRAQSERATQENLAMLRSQAQILLAAGQSE